MQNMTNAKMLLAVFEDVSDVGKFYLWNINWRKEAEMTISKTIVNLNETRHFKKKKKNFPLETKNKNPEKYIGTQNAPVSQLRWLDWWFSSEKHYHSNTRV